MLGYDPLRVEVLLYQLVHLTRGGVQTRMSKRRGDIVTLDEFMDEVGVDAARWYLVNRGPDQTIEIDVDLAAEKTQKNPVYYVQYAHARIAGILRNAPVRGQSLGTAPVQPLAREERELVKRLLEFPALVAEATERRAPQALPNLRDPRRRRLPPLLPRASRARERAARASACARPRDATRDRALPRPDRRRGTRTDVESARGERRQAARPQPRARSRPRDGGRGDGCRTLDRSRRQERGGPGSGRRDARDARHRPDGRERRHRRGGEGRGADALQRRVGRRRQRPARRRRRRSARGDAPDGARPAECDRRDRGRRARDDVLPRRRGLHGEDRGRPAMRST